MKRRLFAAVLLSLAILLPTQVRADEPLLAVSETYRSGVYYQRLRDVVLRGDYRADLINVALSQVGYHEGNSLADYAGGNAVGKDNYIEYSSAYYGMNGEWCAMFVSWCARQAGIPKYVINNAARAASDGAGGSAQYYFHIATRRPTDYTPLPGDLVFFSYTGYSSSHVGIVAEVTEDGIRTVEGNSNNAVRINKYDFDSPVIYRYGIYSYSEPGAEIAPISTTQLVFASDTGEDHGIQASDESLAYNFHSLYAMEGCFLQIPTRSFCRDGYTLQGYYLRRCDDGRWLSTERTWVRAEEIQTGEAKPWLLEEGTAVEWTGALTEAEELELHCLWQNAGGLTALDESAAELRVLDSEGWQNPYYDLEESHWYYEDVRAASRAGLLPYTWTFDAWRDSTRGEFILMLYRLLDRPAAEPAVFEDIDPDSEIGAAVSWAYAAGIVKGMDEAHFAPQAPLSREQAVTILYRLCDGAVIGAPVADFADRETVSPWAQEAVTWALEQGLLQGVPVDDAPHLLPRRSMLRPEGVALLHRTERLLPEREVDITENDREEKTSAEAQKSIDFAME